MTIASRAEPTTSATLASHVERAIEVLWLVTAALVPLIFVRPEAMLSEAVNAYVEVPKTTMLRTLVGMMTILWIFEWVLKGGLARHYSIAHYLTRLWNWVTEQPSRWVVVAATFYVIAAIIATLLSQNFYISVWGEVSGQFGYSGYTTVSYFLLFAIVATHLKTQTQMWRLLGVIVITGVLIGIYGVVQHYGGDPLDLGEAGGERISATMANPVFAGSVLVITALLTIGVGLAVLNRWGWTPLRATAWVVVIAIQLMAVFWTGSRGSFLVGVAIAGLPASLALASLTFGPGGFAKSFLMIGAGLLIVLAVVVLTPSPSPGPGGGGESTTAVGQVGERLSSIREVAVRGGVSYRFDIWDASIKLVANREWFEYEDLSISFIRPLVGYGPELFKYTFPLESPLGGLLSQAHNFWLHHWVEQGILGLFGSIGLFVAFFLVGLAQLWNNRNTYSTTHKWLLVALLATMVGRGAEGFWGVNRESDLVLFWLLLAAFVVLPSVMIASQEAEPASVPVVGPQRPLGRRERRMGRAGRRERRSRQAGMGFVGEITPLRVIAMSVVSALVIFLGWLTWDKNVDYFWAGTIAASARDRFSEGQFQEAERLMSEAVSKAPDVPIYYHNLAGIYDAYRQFAINNPDRELPPCEQVFSLDPRVNPLSSDQPYSACAEAAYLTNLSGFRKNTTSPQAKLVLANSTLTLALMGYREEVIGGTSPCQVSCDVEALRYYTELTQMIPSSWPLHNALGTAYLRLGHPEESLGPLERSRFITQGGPQAAQALYLKGLAYRQLERTPEAIDSFEQSLAISSDGPSADETRRQLANIYNATAVQHLQQNEAEAALEPLEKLLGMTQGTPSSAPVLYLQGLAYRELEQLEKAAELMEQSLDVDANGPNAVTIHRDLADVYAALGNDVKAEEHARLLEELQP